MSDVWRSDNFDTLLEKWNDVLTRAVDWKVKVLDETNHDDEYHKFGYIRGYAHVAYPQHYKTTTMEAVCTEDTKSLFFQRKAPFLEYGNSVQADDGTEITMIYKPESSEKTLYFWWHFKWIAARQWGYPEYKVDMDFCTKYSERLDSLSEGGGTDHPSNDLYFPRMEDYKIIVGDKFYNTLIGFSKKLDSIKEEQEAKKPQFDKDGKIFMKNMKKFEDDLRKLEEAKKDRIMDEFNSL